MKIIMIWKIRKVRKNGFVCNQRNIWVTTYNISQWNLANSQFLCRYSPRNSNSFVISALRPNASRSVGSFQFVTSSWNFLASLTYIHIIMVGRMGRPTSAQCREDHTAVISFNWRRASKLQLRSWLTFTSSHRSLLVIIHIVLMSSGYRSFISLNKRHWTMTVFATSLVILCKSTNQICVNDSWAMMIVN